MLNQDGYLPVSIESVRLGGKYVNGHQAPLHACMRNLSQREERQHTHVLQVFDIGGDSDAELGLASDNAIKGIELSRPLKVSRLQKEHP